MTYICKYCQKEISWNKDGERNIPVNLDGTRHDCRKREDARPQPPKITDFQKAEEAMAKQNPSPLVGDTARPLSDLPNPFREVGSVKIAVHIDLGSYSNFDLEVNGATGEQARALLEQESKPVIALCKKIMRDAKEDI